jgi:hypothetical protein
MKSPALAVLLGAVLASTAHGQTLDHLKCHKMKDTLRLKATVDLTALDPNFSAQGCTIGKAKLFCIPATKSNVQPPTAAPLDINGQQLTNGFICYIAKCPAPQPPDTGVSDQFGSRTLTKFVTSYICAPAIEGTVTTSTTQPGATTTTTTMPANLTCGNAADPECNGPCSTPGNICADVGGGHCGCVAGSAPCGQVQGPTTGCAGTCATGGPYCKTIGSGSGASCVCSATP